MKHPIRVASNGSLVLLGSGRIFNAITLGQVDTLSNDVADAVWWSGTLFTMRAYDGGTQLQRWGHNYGVEATRTIYERPIRLFLTRRGLLAVTHSLGETHFSLWDFHFNQTYEPRVYLPLAARQAAPVLTTPPR